MRLPEARGGLSAAVIERLRSGKAIKDARLPNRVDVDPLADEDVQLALAVCYELHYTGFDDVDDRWEWDPGLLALRADIERLFERELREQVGPQPATSAAEIPAALTALTAEREGPSLARYIQSHATIEQFREFVVHRSLYQLKEADPHTFAIPRLTGRAKAALIEIQIDEYGSGRLARMHAELFRNTMGCLGLDTDYGAYLDRLPAVTLAVTNMLSMFALHRRLRAALTGQLAAFEMSSSLPNSRYGNGLRRLGGDSKATLFYDEHVEADAVHEQIAAYDMCGSLVAEHPELAADVLFGAAGSEVLGGRVSAHLLDSWAAGRSSLRAGTAARELLPETDVLAGAAA
ncbi:iron-containing redox enzyme family protein [Catellatospora sp. NPDC049111]|uniref:iron-containing redox enzyme family protein n=1 Tax=Catellatospora sp. NPDC049111 TaxID=3155271 RepID=UPI0033C57A9C